MSIINALQERWREKTGYAAILKVGLPLIVSMASSTVMQFTDRLFLSHYSVDAIAAALPASLASLTIMLTLMGVSSYSSVLIAQYIGSNAPRRVGAALWQGIWCALAGSVILGLMWWAAGPLFEYVGHEAAVREMEIEYFRIVTAGSGLALVGAAVGGFFSGRGQTRPVMIANVCAAIINIPLDYLLIFGGWGFPALGVAGAALATVAGWLVGLLIIAYMVFTRANEESFAVLSGWRPDLPLFRRLLYYGAPSGASMCLDLASTTWFSFEVGQFGKIAQAASSIAFSINSVVFLPMLGLSIAVSTLAGQSMGAGRPRDVERIAINSLHMAQLYMLPLALCFVLFSGPLMDLFAPSDMTPAAFVPVRDIGKILLCFIALYSLVDACNIVYFGALKGVGDTVGIMVILVIALVFLLLIPVYILKTIDMHSVYSLWALFSTYVIVLAMMGLWRFYRRGWRGIRMVETALPVEEK